MHTAHLHSIFLTVQASILKCLGVYFKMFLRVRASIPEFSGLISQCSGLYSWMVMPLTLMFISLFLNVLVSISECYGLFFLNFHVSISEYSYIYFWMFKFPPEKCSLFRPLFLNVQASILKCSGLYSCFSGLYLWMFRSLFLIVQISIHEFSGLYSWMFRSLFFLLFRSLFLTVPVSIPEYSVLCSCMFKSSIPNCWVNVQVSFWLRVKSSFVQVSITEFSGLYSWLFRSLFLIVSVSIPECSCLHFLMSLFLNVQFFIPECSGLFLTESSVLYCSGLYYWMFRSIFLIV